MTTTLAAQTNQGFSEREVSFDNHFSLTSRRRDHDRLARTPARRKELLSKRVAIAKRAKAIEGDKEWHKNLALADDTIEAAKREYDEANAPFVRLRLAKEGVHNAHARRAGIENSHQRQLIDLGREADGFQDFELADIIGELQSAHDAAMSARTGPGIERARQTLKSALEMAVQLPYRFTGSFSRWESILDSLRRLAHSRGSEMENVEQWNSADIFEPVELDGAGK